MFQRGFRGFVSEVCSERAFPQVIPRVSQIRKRDYRHINTEQFNTEQYKERDDQAGRSQQEGRGAMEYEIITKVDGDRFEDKDVLEALVMQSGIVRCKDCAKSGAADGGLVCRRTEAAGSFRTVPFGYCHQAQRIADVWGTDTRPRLHCRECVRYSDYPHSLQGVRFDGICKDQDGSVRSCDPDADCTKCKDFAAVCVGTCKTCRNFRLMPHERAMGKVDGLCVLGYIKPTDPFGECAGYEQV